MSQTFSPITVLGAGSWGTALALYLARRGQKVKIWSFDISEVDEMHTHRASFRYLPEHRFPDSILPMAELREAVVEADDILIVVPSIGFRRTLETIKPMIKPSARFVCATKGLDAETGELLSKVAQQVLGSTHPFAVLSGPSFAKEVAKGLPTAVDIASKDLAFQQDLMQRFESDIFHIELSDDIIGVELGGVVKNVIAIATGIADGLKFGTNTRSALITYGLAEMTRLGLAMGAKSATFMGLSGLGDLILTCSDDQSRNRRLGLHIGTGKTVVEAHHEIGQVVEGGRNAHLVTNLATQYGVEMPICQTTWSILQGELSAEPGIKRMLNKASLLDA